MIGQGSGKRAFALIGVLCLLLLSLSACITNSNNSNNGPSNSSSSGPIKIGYTVPRSGDFSGDGPLLEQGYQLWAKYINSQGGLLGHQVQLIGLDDASKPDQVTADYQKLISSDRVDLLFAPFSGDLTVPAAIVAKRYGYPFVEGAATEKATYLHGLDNLFAVSLPAEKYITSFADFILSIPSAQRPRTAAYVTSNDTFTQPQVQAAQALLERGVSTVLYKAYTPETTNFTSLSAAIVASKAQVVVLGTLDAGSLGQFLKYFRQQHYNPQALIAASGPDQGQAFLDAITDKKGDNAFATKMAEGVFVPNDGWYPGIHTYQNDLFQQLWQAQNPGQPLAAISSDTVQGFAAAQVLQQAVQNAKTLNKQTLIQYLRTNTFNSIQGPVQFDAQGRNIASAAFLFQWQQGTLIPVYPTSQALKNPEFPKSSWP